MTNIFLSFFLLQIDASNFEIQSTINLRDVIVFSAVLAAIFVVIIILNATSKRGPSGSKSSGGSSGAFSGILGGFALHKLAREIGLNHDQTRMLDFVFKTDMVTDPEKSLSTPALLDRHFRRAYRVIEQSSNSEDEAQQRLSVLFSTRNMLESSNFGSLSSTRQLKENTVLTLTYGKEKYSVATLSTKGENLAVETPKNVLGSAAKIQRGEKLQMLVFTKSNKGFSFETRAIGYANVHGESALLLAHSNQMRFLSQRRFRRRQTNIASNMFLVYVEGSGKKQKMIVDKRRISGNIADISVGGCSVRTGAPVKAGAMFKIEFTQEASKVAALGQVLRINRAGINTVLHIKFLRVTTRSMNIINAFVYEYAHE
ncbi:MAG: PilZ domain-containing protein [Treponema sp.]|nr:PilZ domain-containing protein [Treponema sp.]